MIKFTTFFQIDCSSRLDLGKVEARPMVRCVWYKNLELVHSSFSFHKKQCDWNHPVMCARFFICATEMIRLVIDVCGQNLVLIPYAGQKNPKLEIREENNHGMLKDGKSGVLTCPTRPPPYPLQPLIFSGLLDPHWAEPLVPCPECASSALKYQTRPPGSCQSSVSFISWRSRAFQIWRMQTKTQEDTWICFILDSSSDASDHSCLKEADWKAGSLSNAHKLYARSLFLERLDGVFNCHSSY